MPTSRSVLAALTSVAAVVAGGALLAPANANLSGTGLVISEVYLNGGSAGATYTNKYVELANPTGTAISLSGLSLQYRPATGTGNASTAVALAGTVPAHGFFVVQGATNGANGDPVPSPDQSAAGLNPAAGGGTLFVANGTAAINPGTGSVTTGVVDLLGWGTSNTFEGTAAPIGSVTTGPSRSVDETDTDVNSVDFKTQALTPGAGNGVTPPPIPTEHTIAEIQGTGATSPLVGQPVITQGVVTAAYPTGGFFGYVLQTDGTGTGDDATPGASDAIFVHQPSGAVNVTVGDELQVTGSVSEFQGLTELNVDAADIHDLGAPPLGGVTARSMAYPTTTADREAHESELIAPTNQFTVTDNFDANTFGEIGLATGDKQLWQPTDLFNPNLEPAQVAAVQADNAARGVVLNDGSSANYTSNASGTPLPWLRPDNPVRIGSSATLHQAVILDFRNSLWEFQPTHQVIDDGSAVATFGDTRTPNLTPADVGGDLKLGTFNVLNYFNTTGRTGSPPVTPARSSTTARATR